MSLLTLTRKMVKTAKKLAEPFEATVQYSAWVAGDAYGEGSYPVTIPLKAIVDQSVREHRNKDGLIIAVKADVMFIEALPVNGAPGRTEPIDMRDIIVLPDRSDNGHRRVH